MGGWVERVARVLVWGAVAALGGGAFLSAVVFVPIRTPQTLPPSTNEERTGPIPLCVEYKQSLARCAGHMPAEAIRRCDAQAKAIAEVSHWAVDALSRGALEAQCRLAMRDLRADCGTRNN
jgi:hypothetical protein